MCLTNCLLSSMDPPRWLSKVEGNFCARSRLLHYRNFYFGNSELKFHESSAEYSFWSVHLCSGWREGEGRLKWNLRAPLLVVFWWPPGMYQGIKEVLVNPVHSSSGSSDEQSGWMLCFKFLFYFFALPPNALRCSSTQSMWMACAYFGA